MKSLRFLVVLILFAAGTFAYFYFSKNTSIPFLENPATEEQKNEPDQNEDNNLSFYKKKVAEPEQETNTEPEVEPQVEAEANFYIQLLATSSENKANSYLNLHKGAYPLVVQKYEQEGKTLFRLRVGPYKTRDEAEEVKKVFVKQFKEAYVIEED